MTIKQYFSTFLLGLADYLKDVRHDMLVKDLYEIDKDVINPEYAFSWKEGNLRHYVRQRRIFRKTKETDSRWRLPEIESPKDGRICLVRMTGKRRKVALLKYHAKTDTYETWHNGKNQLCLKGRDVASWAYFLPAFSSDTRLKTETKNGYKQ